MIKTLKLINYFTFDNSFLFKYFRPYSCLWYFVAYSIHIHDVRSMYGTSIYVWHLYIDTCQLKLTVLLLNVFQFVISSDTFDEITLCHLTQGYVECQRAWKLHDSRTKGILNLSLLQESLNSFTDTKKKKKMKDKDCMQNMYNM